MCKNEIRPMISSTKQSFSVQHHRLYFCGGLLGHASLGNCFSLLRFADIHSCKAPLGISHRNLRKRSGLGAHCNPDLFLFPPLWCRFSGVLGTSASFPEPTDCLNKLVEAARWPGPSVHPLYLEPVSQEDRLSGGRAADLSSKVLVVCRLCSKMALDKTLNLTLPTQGKNYGHSKHNNWAVCGWMWYNTFWKALYLLFLTTLGEISTVERSPELLLVLWLQNKLISSVLYQHGWQQVQVFVLMSFHIVSEI